MWHQSHDVCVDTGISETSHSRETYSTAPSGCTRDLQAQDKTFFNSFGQQSVFLRNLLKVTSSKGNNPYKCFSPYFFSCSLRRTKCWWSPFAVGQRFFIHFQVLNKTISKLLSCFACGIIHLQRTNSCSFKAMNQRQFP